MSSLVSLTQRTAAAAIDSCQQSVLLSGHSMLSVYASLALISAVACALLCSFGPTELPELVIGIFGAIIYATYQQAAKVSTKKRSKSVKLADAEDASTLPERGSKARPLSGGERRHSKLKQKLPSAPKVQCRQESVVPVSGVVFQNLDWENQVDELLQQIRPDEESDTMVQCLVQASKRALRTLLPEADVVGCASGNVKGKRAFGVAIPEVDLVMTISPAALIHRLRSRLPNGAYLAKLDAKKLQKAAIRACADQLVSAGGFKFRRSAFKGEEPRFTLLAPASLAAGDCSIAIDFSVNAATPLQGAALFREIANVDARATDVILLVRRWARDRGIAHAARGHLSPYGWMLLATYFLQTGAVQGGAGILPALPAAPQKQPGFASDAAVSPGLSPAHLFKLCLLFYSNFNWRKEAVSVRLARRGPPGIALPVHVTLSEDRKTTYVAPSIEDPFNESRNIAASMSAEGVMRFGEELERASKLISEGASLSELLELWSPPDERDTAEAATEAPSD